MRVERVPGLPRPARGHGPRRERAGGIGRGDRALPARRRAATRSSARSRRATASASASPPRSSTTRACWCSTSRRSGLDPKQIIAIRELIRELGREHTLLLSTHILPEVELLCGRVLIIDRGRIVAEGTPRAAARALARQRGGDGGARRASRDGAAEALATRARRGRGARRGARGRRRRASSTSSAIARRDLREPVFRPRSSRAGCCSSLAQSKASLEDVFVRLTTHDRAAEAVQSASPREEVVQ